MPYFCFHYKCTGRSGNAALANKGVERISKDGTCPLCKNALVWKDSPRDKTHTVMKNKMKLKDRYF